MVKAFNTNFAATLAAGTVGDQPTTVLIAGDDADAKSLLAGIVTAGGLRAVDAGSLRRARELEALGFLQIDPRRRREDRLDRRLRRRRLTTAPPPDRTARGRPPPAALARLPSPRSPVTTPASSTAAADARIPAEHPFAAHLRRSAALEAVTPHRAWTPEDGPLPSLYLSHGGGPMPFASTDWLDPLHDWARSLPKPKAILVVSAHWESAPLSVSAARPSELVYDFGGFDPLYYTFRYDTPDGGELARGVPPDAGHRARARARPARPGPRRLGSAEDHVPGGRRPRAAAEPAHRGPGPTAGPGRAAPRRCARTACSSSDRAS